MKLPTRQVDVTSPNHDHAPAEPVRGDHTIADAPKLEGRDETFTGGLAVALLASPPPRAAMKLGGIYAQQSKALGTASQGVAVDYDGRGTDVRSVYSHAATPPW